MAKLSQDTDSKRPSWLMWGGMALFIGWLFFSLSATYVAQKPFSPAQLAALGEVISPWRRFSFSTPALVRSLLDAAAALWLAWIALGAGLWLLARLTLSPLAVLERLLFGLGLGFGGLGLLGLFLGLAGWLETAVFTALATLLTLLTSRETFALVRQLRWTRPARPIRFYLTLTLGLAFCLALLPPASWDSLSYHLQGPRLYLQMGRIAPGPDIMPLHYPSLFEMLFMMALALRGDAAATLLHFIFIFPLSGLVYATTRRHLRGSAGDGWTAVLCPHRHPHGSPAGSLGVQRSGAGLLPTGGIDRFIRWRETRQPGWLTLAGIMAGLALGLKYTGFIAPLMTAVFIGWEYRRDWRAGIRPLRQFAAPALLVAAPWFVKNWLFTGNPVYPFLFNGRYWDDYRAAGNANAGTGLGFDPVALLRLPYDLTLGYKDISQDGPLGSLFLMFLPLLLGYGLTRWRRRPPAALHYLLLMALGQYLFWTAGVIASANLWQSRYLLPGLAALCPALAWMLADLTRWDRPQFSLRRFLNLVIGVAVGLGLIGQILAWLPRAPLAYALGDETRQAVLTRQLGAHYGAMTAVNRLPAEARVVFLWEPRAYYCDRNCQPDIILDKLGHLAYLHGGADAIAAAWRQEGVTHLLLFQAGLEFVAADIPGETAILQDLQSRHLQPVADIAGAYILYELLP